MNTTWKLKEAKKQFNKLIEYALTHGPQYVTRHDSATVVIVSAKDYETLTAQRPSFTEFLLSCPTLDKPLELERQPDYPRSISL
jgi:prevent-host-death family protein